MRTITLVGGNEFRPNCVPMDERLLRLAPRRPARVLIVPTAAAHERPELAVQNGVRHFTSLGSTASGLLALTRADWESDEPTQPVLDADVVYFTGGDPWYLLRTIRETPLLAAILERGGAGAILAGSSAGAMVLGGWMRERTGGWARALGVLPHLAVIPHYRTTGSRDSRALRASLPDDVTLLGIGEATGCVSRDGKRWEVVGANAVEVIGPTAARGYSSGQTFALE